MIDRGDDDTAETIRLRVVPRDTAVPPPRGPRRAGVGLAVLLVVLAVVSAVVTWGVYRFMARDAVAGDRALVARGVVSAGTVTSGTAGSLVVYRFSAGRLVYEGRGKPGPGVARTQNGVVQVRYDPTDPTLSCVCDPAARLERLRRDMLVAAGLSGVGVPAVGLLAAWSVGRRRRDALV